MLFEIGLPSPSSPETVTATEWLVTNGIGGYAAGTVGNALTRRYHGVLVAALDPPTGRTVLVSKLEETVRYLDRTCPLFTNRWNAKDSPLTPSGYLRLARFRLEGTTPVWSYTCADAWLEKRVWMAPGANTTYTRYDLHHATAPLTLDVKALVHYRDHHTNRSADGRNMAIESVRGGLRVTAFKGATPFYLLHSDGKITPHHSWYRNYFLSSESDRGLDPTGDHLHAATVRASLSPGDSLTIVASTQPDPSLDGEGAYSHRQRYERELQDLSGLHDEPAWVRHLPLAADQFLVRRDVEGEPGGRSIIAGYPWFADWSRDTMIALPGLTLCTGRAREAASILRTYSHFVDRGMLPNRFTEDREKLEYNTVDATLWYFQAVRAYHDHTGDTTPLRDLYPVLEEMIAFYRDGTRYGIHADPEDGLLYAGEPGVQLTWMDARVDDRVVTPRIGKPVEINALWYNALRAMSAFASHLDEPEGKYDTLAGRVQESFQRFWFDPGGYCYDVIDGPEGDDASLRPNQLFAVSLPESPLPRSQQRALVDACSRALLTPMGLRSLAPEDPAYSGTYGGSPQARDGAYHQGTVWPWLLGPFLLAHLRVYNDRRGARQLLQPLLAHLQSGCVGQISEIADGDPPHRPRGAFAQAWSVAALLESWFLTAT